MIFLQKEFSFPECAEVTPKQMYRHDADFSRDFTLSSLVAPKPWPYKRTPGKRAMVIKGIFCCWEVYEKLKV